jgi:hypothetical protein
MKVAEAAASLTESDTSSTPRDELPAALVCMECGALWPRPESPPGWMPAWLLHDCWLDGLTWL